ncbi:MAG: hypothetical protein IH613_13505 [Desulfuromonadales bacterium]|nr:hypothetical protein [Desulfuromonadales bacterium]
MRKPPPAYILDEFKARCEAALNNVEAYFNHPLRHEDYQNPESIEGVYIKNIRNFSKYIIDGINDQENWVDITNLLGLMIAITRMETHLASARHMRALLGRPESTLKAAVNEAQFYSAIGKELHPKIEQDKLNRILKDERIREAKIKAGRNSHNLKAEERTERNQYFQKEINRLCLDEGYGYMDASEKISGDLANSTWKLSARKIRENTTNPR